MDIYLDDSERDVWVVAAILTDKPKNLKKVMRRTKKAKLAKREWPISEIKASQASKKFKQYFYERLARLRDVRIYCIYLEKNRIPQHLQGQQGLIYLRMVIALLERAHISQHRVIYLYADEKPLKGMTRQAFVVTLKAHFATSFQQTTRFEVYVRRSHEDEGIQVADFISNALFEKYQYGKTKWYDFIQSFIQDEINATQIL